MVPVLLAAADYPERPLLVRRGISFILVAFVGSDTEYATVTVEIPRSADAVFASAGRILLQWEGSEIFFRKIELHPVSFPGAT